MIHRSLRFLLQSPKPPPPLLLRLLSGHHPLPPPPLPHPNTTTTTTIFSQTQSRRLLSNSSANIKEEAVETTDVFASLKCYAHPDPDLPYYVIDCRRPPSNPLLPPNDKRVPLLPEEELLQQSGQAVEHLECGSCDVYLVGVRRRDEKFSQEVKDIINHLKPEVVFLELCEHRLMVLQKLQDNKTIEAQCSVFIAAFETAVRNDTMVILGDRPFHITVRRILESMLAMRIWEFTKLSFYLLIRFMEYGKENKVFNINDFVYKKLEDLKTFPTLLQSAIHERDLYMSSVLAKIAREHSSVVAVIGLDHVIGIKKHLEQSIEINTVISQKDS